MFNFIPNYLYVLRVLLQIHSIFRWVILILLFLSIVQSFIGWIKRRELREMEAKIWLFTMIVHIPPC